MQFDKKQYMLEMKHLVLSAMEMFLEKQPNIQVFSISIWTDANAAFSSVNFETKANSDKVCAASNLWSKKYYDLFMEEGDIEQAKLHLPIEQNCNPADFEFSDFQTMEHTQFPEHWETESEGACWKELSPLLQMVGDFALEESKILNRHPGFEVAVNGPLDWYEIVFKV